MWMRCTKSRHKRQMCGWVKQECCFLATENRKIDRSCDLYWAILIIHRRWYKPPNRSNSALDGDRQGTSANFSLFCEIFWPHTSISWTSLDYPIHSSYMHGHRQFQFYRENFYPIRYIPFYQSFGSCKLWMQ